MKLSDAKENYYYFSGKLSDIARQLNFAGIAVVWVVVQKDTGKIPGSLDSIDDPLFYFALGLALDLAHYMVSTFSWGVFHRIMERRGGGQDDEFLAPRWINWLALVFFWVKVFCTVVGYVFLLQTITP